MTENDFASQKKMKMKEATSCGFNLISELCVKQEKGFVKKIFFNWFWLQFYSLFLVFFFFFKTLFILLFIYGKCNLNQ